MAALTTCDVLRQGLDLVGVDTGRIGDTAKETKFRAHFGSNPQVYRNMYEDLLGHKIIDSPNDLPLTTLLMVIFWLCHYPTEHLQSSRFGMCNETCRKWNWHVVRLLHELFEIKIRWPARFSNANYHQHIIGVDGIHCLTKEKQTDTRPYNRLDFSHKHGCASFTYEVGCAVWMQRCVWVNGPFPAGTSDLQMFRMQDGEGRSISDRCPARWRRTPATSLKATIPVGKKAIADHGLRAETEKVAVSRSTDSERVRNLKARVKAREENFNGRLKNFAVLDHKFRHGAGDDGPEKHGLCFRAVVCIVQYQLENGSPLFNV